jgi:hypothetical protein
MQLLGSLACVSLLYQLLGCPATFKHLGRQIVRYVLDQLLMRAKE